MGIKCLCAAILYDFPFIYLYIFAFAFLQPDLAEGEEAINQRVVELNERLYQQVALHNFYQFSQIYATWII